MLGEHELAVLRRRRRRTQCDPENEDAALPLVDEYVDTEQWARAEPLPRCSSGSRASASASEQHDLQNKLGKVLPALGKNEGALKAYRPRASSTSPTR